MTTKEFNPFLFYSTKLEQLFAKAAKKDDPAMWLYKNDVRTILFMLEALTRLHNKAFDEKVFDKWNRRFKKLEDLFGEIDNHYSLREEFKVNKKISDQVVKYFSVHVTNCVERCNRRLKEKDWLNHKLDSFNDKLIEFSVEYNQEYMNQLKLAIIEEVDAIVDFVQKLDYKFTKLEEHIHEIRRKLRWISIYAQSLQGLIQLKKSTERKKTIINYFTKEVMKSSFNKLPSKRKNTTVIEFDADSFYALSWLIDELGELKDEGLKVHALRDAIFISEELTEGSAKDKAAALLGFKKTIDTNILKRASATIKTVISEDKILDRLIIG
ncbi:MAG: hypothetical protein V4565_05515 [Bacteroidota bacterium]